MIVVMCCTKSWEHYLCVSLFSLLKTNLVQKVYLFLEEDIFFNAAYFSKFSTKIIVYNYHTLLDKYLKKDNQNKNTYYSEATLVRLFISEYIPEEKIFYLDTDAIVLKDLTPLWNINIEDYYLAGVEDKNILNYLDYMDLKKLPSKCLNAGILLMNLDLFRQNDLTKKFIKLLNEEIYCFPDQDILNIICHEKTLFLDNTYNASLATGFPKDPSILHYVSQKKAWVKNLPFSDIWYQLEQDYLTDQLEIDCLIPAYNAHKHIENCLKSLRQQTIKDKIKITIINDGSNENYQKIIKKYQEELNIEEIILKKNKGISIALQTGLEKTNLPYFFLLDSDDTLFDEFSLEYLYQKMKNNSFKKVEGKILCENKPIHSKTFMHGKLIERKFVSDHQIKFQKLYSYEDLAFNLHFDFLCNPKEISQINQVVYIYHKFVPSSLTMTKKDKIKLLKSAIKAYQYALKKVKNERAKSYAFILFKDMSLKYNEYLKTSSFIENEQILYLKICHKFYHQYQKYIDKFPNSSSLTKFIDIIQKW